MEGFHIFLPGQYPKSSKAMITPAPPSSSSPDDTWGAQVKKMSLPRCPHRQRPLSHYTTRKKRSRSKHSRNLELDLVPTS